MPKGHPKNKPAPVKASELPPFVTGTASGGSGRGPIHQPAVAKIPEPKPTHSVVKLLVNYHPVLAHELIVSSAPTNISDTLKAGSTVKLDAEEAAGLIADGRAEAA